MKKLFIPACFAALLLTACSSADITQSASGKNVDLSGYLMYGKVESVSTDTVSPQGTLILGRAAYKSRKVSIPADQKVPNTGSYRATKTTSIFGTAEEIIEYDFTASENADLSAFSVPSVITRTTSVQKGF